VGGHRLGGLQAGVAATNGKLPRHADFDFLELADIAVAHALAGHAHLQAGAPPGAALQHPLVLLHRPADGAAFDDAGPEGLFRIQILPRLCRSDGHIGMPVVRRGVHNGIHITARQHLAEVFEDRGLGQSCQFGCSGGVLGVHITDGNDLHTFIRHQRPQVARPLPAHTDAGEAYFLIRRYSPRTAKRGGGDNERNGGAKKLTTSG
jgi:hypothetical protein